MKKEFLKELMKTVGDEYATVIHDKQENYEFYDTGSLTLNALLSGSIFGGLPSGLITAFAGPESVGKTFIALSVAKNFLNQNKDSYVYYFESEGAIRKEMLKQRGIDLKRFIIHPVDTIETFRSKAFKLMKYYEENPNSPKILIVLDSMGNLSTNKELEDVESEKNVSDMTRQRLIKATFRVLTLKVEKLNLPMIVTNHVYTKIGSMDPTPEMAGGGGLKYCASNIVFFGKRKFKEGTDIIGAVIPATLKKGRFTKENSKILMNLKYDSGLEQYYGLIDLAVKHNIFNKVGKQIVVDGKKRFEKAIYKNPKEYFTKEVLKQIDSAAKKEFTYGGRP